jgi:hypothetical protein
VNWKGRRSHPQEVTLLGKDYVLSHYTCCSMAGDGEGKGY